jgi:hypothetical protein
MAVQNAINSAVPTVVAKGGTGLTTATTAYSMVCSGTIATGAFQVLDSLGTTGQILTSNGSSSLPMWADNVNTAGYTAQPAVAAASTVNFTATYNNGTAGVGATLTNNTTQAVFSIDSVSPPVNARVLIKDQTNEFENGCYTITDVGSGSTNWVLTRATDYDETTEILPGTLFLVTSGTTNGGTRWYETATVAAIGTDDVLFSQFENEGIVAAWVDFNGTGTVAIRGSGNVASITDNATGDYTMNFTDPTIDANYAMSGACGGDSSSVTNVLNIPATSSSPYEANATTTSVRMATYVASVGFKDMRYVSVVITR